MNPSQQSVKVLAPATVSNVACGFDIMGYAVDYPGDTLEATILDKPGIVFESITGAELPSKPEHNLVGIVATHMLERLGSEAGVSFNIHKHVKPGSGLGSSASSSVATAVAMNALFGNPFSDMELIQFAMSGEQVASNNFHADNVAPCLLGGFILIRGYDPLDLIQIQYPEDLYTTIIHPDVEVKTSEARAALGNDIPLKTAITQWGNVAGLITGLHTGDYDLIGRSLVDVIAEPIRSEFIPHYDEIKALAVDYGTIGCNISGSGPAIFILSQGKQDLSSLIDEASQIFAKSDIGITAFTSPVHQKGAHVVE